MKSEKNKCKGWHGERKRHRDVQLKADLKDILRQPIEIVKKIEDKGYPTSESDYLASHKIAEDVEKKVFGTKAFNELEEIIDNELPDGQLLGTHRRGIPEISSLVPNEYIPEVQVHEVVEHALMEADGGTDAEFAAKMDKFKKDFGKELTRLKKNNPDDTTISEFRRWLKEDLMPFDQKPAFEQIKEKIDYEIDIGNDSKVFKDIEAWLDIWMGNNEEAQDEYIWYHGTTEDTYRKIKESGEIKVSTKETFQHPGFEHDIGTISLAKYKSMAHFFSALSGILGGTGKKNQVILHIDTTSFDPAAIKKRKLISTPDGEMLYRKNIPVSTIVKVETVHTGTKP